MPIFSRGVSIAVFVLTFAIHTAASGQTGILHKGGPLGRATLPVAAAPAASTVNAGRGGGRTIAGGMPVSPHASRRLPASIGINGTARILPMGTPKFTDGIPPGIEKASHVAAPQALGLERAKAVTAGALGQVPSQAGRQVGSEPAADIGADKPDAIGIPSHAQASPTARAAVTNHVQPVSQLPANARPRWQDRLRFAWPRAND